jgi:spermidine synthase
VGVIGLGIGTLAAYGRSGDFMRFYEIDPSVIRVARDSGEFSYLSDSDAEIELVLGDARISIATEQALDPSLDFDILIVDAFNSDTVPVHLMTQEMFENYVGALTADGLLAFHVSNRHFDLMRLVARMGMEAGLQSITVVTFTSIEHLSLKARWVFLARERNQITRLERDLKRGHRALGIEPSLIRTHFTRLIDVKRVPVWTDDYSDLYSLLKRKW